MQSFNALLLASVRMLLRNRMLLISSLGLALISILVFGWLFGGGGNVKFALGVVNQDSSTVSTQMIQQLKQSDALTLSMDTESQGLAALQAGQRDAVIVIGADFGASLRQGHARLKVYYNQSNPTTLAITQQALQSIVENINREMTGQAPPLTLQEAGVSVHNLRQIDFILPGMLGMMLMWTNLSTGGALVEWRERGVLRRLAATPLRSSTLISTQMLARLILSLLQAAVLILVGRYVFQVQVVGSWLLLGLAVVLGTLTMLGVGLGIGSIAKNADSAQAITFLVSFPMMFLSGSYFSTSSAPTFLKPLISVLPLTYLNDALRQVMNNGASLSTIQTDLLVLAAWIVAGFLLASRTFRWAR
ncbi:MAG: ABC transporter permease [Chloroflexota bacterium]|nr:ABC transporter permease [Chloroflexota bacterium]